jgi:methylaspartate ammonia-lyase
MLVLDDGQIAFGDFADVILAGVAGRDPAFNARDHIEYVLSEVADALRGRDVSEFRPNAAAMEDFKRKGARLHTAIRYGVSQALLHASALSRKLTMAEVIAQEYGSSVSTTPIPILASCQIDDLGQLDRVILKRVELLPHATFQIVSEHVGAQGEKLAAFVRRVAARCEEIGAPDYNPRIHVDLYGTLGELFSMNIEPLAEHLGKLRQESGKYKLLVESPMIAQTQQEQIDKFSALRQLLRSKGIDVGLIADEWCNTLADIKHFAAAGAVDFVQFLPLGKSPPLKSADVLSRRNAACGGSRAACTGAICQLRCQKAHDDRIQGECLSRIPLIPTPAIGANPCSQESLAAGNSHGAIACSSLKKQWKYTAVQSICRNRRDDRIKGGGQEGGRLRVV